MYNFSEIKQLHLEVTSYCNASCPMCTRNINGGVINPHLHLSQLTLDDVKARIPSDFIRNLDLIYFCGNYGDPAMGRDTLDIIRYFRTLNKNLKINFYSNGGARDVSWWSELAPLVDLCQFDIDGLSNTNHLYRRGTKWDKIIAHIKSFISAGGNAGWEYVVFEHNQEQVAEAKSLSVELGFKYFVAKKTNRFLSIDNGSLLDKWDVFDQYRVYQYSLKPSTKSEFMNHEVAKFRGHRYEEYLERTPISCKVAKDKSIYISADGYVFPCCWMAHIYNRGVNETEQVIKMISEKQGNLSAISLFENDLPSIIGGRFFSKQVPESWSCSSIANGKLQVCARVCGAIDTTKSQFEESESVGLHVPGASNGKNT